MFRTTRTNDKAHGDYEFHPLGNPSFERAAIPPRAPVAKPDRVEVETDTHLWTVPYASLRDACFAAVANDAAKLTELGGVVVKAI